MCTGGAALRVQLVGFEDVTARGNERRSIYRHTHDRSGFHNCLAAVTRSRHLVLHMRALNSNFKG